MKVREILALLVATYFSGCASRYLDPPSPPLINTSEAIARYAGKNVRLVGEVSNTKIPQILGVDVTSDEPDLRGTRAEAYGVLKRFVVTKEEAQALDEKFVGHRGTGTYWILYDPKAERPAQVSRPPIVSPIIVPAR